LVGSKSTNDPVFAVLVDLVKRKSKTNTGRLAVSKDFIFVEKPTECPACEGTDFRGYEVLGAYDGPLLWECSHCEMRYPRFSIEKMERLLEKVAHLWTNPNDWGYKPKDEFN
jgi:hypothetical protein